MYNNQRIKKIECHFLIIERVVNNWKKDGLYGFYQDDLWTWAVQLIYWTINELPPEFRRKYAVRMIELMQKDNVKDYLIAGYEQLHLKELKEWQISDNSSEDEIEMLKKRIDREKYEIEETVKSKAFKLGKFFTKSRKRINVQEM